MDYLIISKLKKKIEILYISIKDVFEKNLRCLFWDDLSVALLF